MRIGLIGDRNDEVRAHRAIPVALARAGERLGVRVEEAWLPTSRIPLVPDYVLGAFDGLWCVPGSPYASMERALAGIEFARENRTPFLGTCGGFQHVLIEYARNVAGLGDADHAESNPDATTLLVTPLVCSLVGESGPVTLDPDTRAAEWYGGLEGTEEYICSFGLNPEHRELFEQGPLRIVGRDDAADPRVVELAGHSFFVATLFQPELRSEGDGVHPLVIAFVEVCVKASPQNFYLSALETTVRIIEGNAFRFAGITELALGQRVRVWSRGVIQQSYPEQTGAGQVDILER